MSISRVVPQLWTTDLAASIRFYTTKLGLTLAFEYEDFYAGIGENGQRFHLKLVDQKDPSIDFVDKGGHFHLYFEVTDLATTAASLKSRGVDFVKDVHETSWGTRELVIKDDQGHILYFGENRQAG